MGDKPIQFVILMTDTGLKTTHANRSYIVHKITYYFSQVILTYDIESDGEGVLAGSVGRHARVGATVPLVGPVNDEGVDSVLVDDDVV